MVKTAKHLTIQKRYSYYPELEVCPYCGGPLKTQAHYRWRKTVQQLSGAIHVTSRGKQCRNPQCKHYQEVFHSAQAQMVSLPECTYGLDVIAQIGWWRDREHLNRKQIHRRLREQGVQISEREVDNLYAHYQVLLSCTERLKRPDLAELVQKQGGMLISLDGLEPEGAAEQLWVVLEVQLGLVLVAAWLPKVNHETLKAILQPVLDLQLPLLATLSDKQSCVRKALEELLPETPHQWCQSHYLGNAARPVYERDSNLKTELRKTLRQEFRKSMPAVLADPERSDFSPSVSHGLGN